MCSGLIRWADQPSKKTIYWVNEIVDNRELEPGDRYYISLVETIIPSNPAPATPDSPPPPPAPSDPFASHPDPDPTVNPLLGKAITSLLCFQGPTAQDSCTVSELIGHTTELSEDMTYAKMYDVRLFRRYLQLCAAEHSLSTLVDHSILCIGLLRWAKFPRNNLIYICFESYPPAAHPGNRWRLKLNGEFHPGENAPPAPVPPLAPYETVPMDLFADSLLSKIITDLLKKPSPQHDDW